MEFVLSVANRRLVQDWFLVLSQNTFNVSSERFHLNKLWFIYSQKVRVAFQTLTDISQFTGDIFIEQTYSHLMFAISLMVCDCMTCFSLCCRLNIWFVVLTFKHFFSPCDTMLIYKKLSSSTTCFYFLEGHSWLLLILHATTSYCFHVGEVLTALDLINQTK